MTISFINFSSINDVKESTSFTCDTDSREMTLFFNGKLHRFSKSVVVGGVISGSWPSIIYISETLLVFLCRYIFNIVGIIDTEKNAMYLDENFRKKDEVEAAYIEFKEMCASNESLYKAYINNKESGKTALFFGAKHVMHNLINELFGAFWISEKTKIHTILSRVNFYGDYKFLFDCDNVQKLNKLDIFKYICENNLIILTENKAKKSSEIIDKIIKYHCKDYNISTKLNKKFVYTIRSTHRKMHNQIDFIVENICFLEKKFPNSTHIIHGSVKMFETNMLMDKVIRNELNILNLILNKVKEKYPSINIISNINENISTAIRALIDTDLYIAHIGTLQHFVAFFSKACGIVHGGHSNNYFHKGQKVEEGYLAQHWFEKKATIFSESCFKYDIDKVRNKLRLVDRYFFNSNYEANIANCLDFLENHEYFKKLL